ncbi:MAG: ORF6N domain-containing protein [Bacteroidota bacterium]
MKQTQLVPFDLIEHRIFLLRGQRVMFDRDLAELYGVETKYLNRQVKRNRERFPREFMFQVTNKERNELVTNWHRFDSLKHSNMLPFAFTEHGVAMLSSVLHGKRAIRINILIIKVFVKLREILTNHKKLALRLKELEMRVDKHDDTIMAIFDAIRQLMAPPERPKRPIGF